MLSVLKNPTYAKLFGAQAIALIGTGLLTVALGLLAFDLAGTHGGAVMGLAMTIKIVAYVAVAPVVSALTARLPRKPLLITADLVRAAVALCLPFVTEAWQIYVLIFLLQSASATFTPTFQALIPSVLPREADYTRALSLSRLAYDLEALVSPALAAALLTVISYHDLFVGTVVGFLGSTAMVLTTRLPRIAPPDPSRFFDRLTSGIRVFFARGELRGLLALNFVVATSTAMVIVNTVVMVKGDLGRTQADAALLLGANGAGSMMMALVMPRLLDRLDDRRVMRRAATCLPLGLAAAAAVLARTQGGTRWALLVIVWFLVGAATSAVLTPSSRVLRPQQRREDGSGALRRPVLTLARLLPHHLPPGRYLGGRVGASRGGLRARGARLRRRRGALEGLARTAHDDGRLGASGRRLRRRRLRRRAPPGSRRAPRARRARASSRPTPHAFRGPAAPHPPGS